MTNLDINVHGVEEIRIDRNESKFKTVGDWYTITLVHADGRESEVNVWGTDTDEPKLIA